MDCLGELFDPSDRRHRYPFINCTNCGPRFTIIEDVPYDRALTTMRHFPMCGPCAAEYADPSSRRFHAQPNACPGCGPRAWLCDRAGVEVSANGPEAAASALRHGSIVAVKGLGGFQLAVLAGDGAAVRRLRDRKHRPDKPFAVMVRDVATATEIAHRRPGRGRCADQRRAADRAAAPRAGTSPGSPRRWRRVSTRWDSCCPARRCTTFSSTSSAPRW